MKVSTNSTEVNSKLPQMTCLDLTKGVHQDTHLIVAAGFEDRALGLLLALEKSEIPHRITGVSVLNYLPHDPKNDKNRDSIFATLHRWGLSSDNITDFYFDRENPLELSDSIQEFLNTSLIKPYVYLDISAMSKLPILFFLNALWGKNIKFSVIYTEAEKFGPSEEEYRKALQEGIPGQNILPELLFSGVYEPVIPTEFSGSCPLTANRALVAFLGYNKRQIMGISLMIPFQFFIPIIGRTTYKGQEWDWREKALIDINNSDLLSSGKLISEVPNIDIHKGDIPASGEYRLSVSNFDYRETFLTLFAIHEAHKYRYSLTIAPLGTKMHTIGTFLFTRLFPEAQVVYAPPRDFHLKYSEGIKTIWEIPFMDSSRLGSELFAQINPEMAVKGNSVEGVMV